MKPAVVATFAVLGAVVAGAAVATKAPSAQGGGGGGGGGGAPPAPNPTPDIPSAESVLKNGMPPLVGTVIKDIAPNGMIATGVATVDGSAVEITNFNPVTGDFDTLRFGLQKSVGQKFPGLLVSKRGTKMYAQNVDLDDVLARSMDLNGAGVTELGTFQMKLTKGPSHMYLSVGMPVTGDPSNFLTSIAYGDDRMPMTKDQCVAAPDCSAVLEKRVAATFKIASLFG